MRKNILAGALVAVVALACVWVIAGTRANEPKASPKKSEQAQKKTVEPRPLPRMVDVGKTWCIPCQKMVAVLQEAKLRYKGKASIEFVDLEKHPEAARTYKIMMIPTQIFYTADGKEFKRHMGYLPFEDVEKIFAKMGVERSS
jgi:thioredoxin 1